MYISWINIGIATSAARKWTKFTQQQDNNVQHNTNKLYKRIQCEMFIASKKINLFLRHIETFTHSFIHSVCTCFNKNIIMVYITSLHIFSFQFFELFELIHRFEYKNNQDYYEILTEIGCARIA